MKRYHLEHFVCKLNLDILSLTCICHGFSQSRVESVCLQQCHAVKTGSGAAAGRSRGGGAAVPSSCKAVLTTGLCLLCNKHISKQVNKIFNFLLNLFHLNSPLPFQNLNFITISRHHGPRPRPRRPGRGRSLGTQTTQRHSAGNRVNEYPSHPMDHRPSRFMPSLHSLPPPKFDGRSSHMLCQSMTATLTSRADPDCSSRFLSQNGWCATCPRTPPSPCPSIVVWKALIFATICRRGNLLGSSIPTAPSSSALAHQP